MNQHRRARLRAISTPMILAVILLGVVMLAQLTGDRSNLRLVTEVLIRVTLVVGLWIFVGNSGVISFGHVGFMAIGAYASAWLTMRPQMKAMFLPDLWPILANTEWPVFPAAVASGLLAALVALIAGFAILRLSGIAASIATFAFLAIVYTVYSNWSGVTGGTSSVVGLTRYVNEWVALGWAVATIAAAALYANSASGLALRATREDEVAASASGINMYRHRLLSLVVSAFFAGVAGALLGHSIGVLNPDSFYLNITFISLAMLVVGGIGSLSGAVIGVLAVSVLLEALARMESGLSIGEVTFALPSGAQQILIGVAMIVMLILRPSGLTGGREIQFHLRLRAASPRTQPTNQSK